MLESSYYYIIHSYSHTLKEAYYSDFKISVIR